MVNYYTVLGVMYKASTQDIEQAYLRLRRRSDPDITGYARGPAFKVVKEAYEILRDAEKRRNYDMKLLTYEHSRTWTHFPPH